MSKLTPGNKIEDKAQLGRRDAFHVPAVAVRSFDYLQGGEQVRFVDKEKTRVERCANGATPHAIVDPFIKETDDEDIFWVFLMPGIVENLVHSFDINLPERTALEEELEKLQIEDPNCAECYAIEDGRVVRY